MKTLLTLLFFCFFLSVSSQENRFAFCIEKSNQKDICEKVIKYLENRDNIYSIVYVCSAQGFFIVDIIHPDYDIIMFFDKISKRFAGTQFLFREIKQMTDFNCRMEYIRILGKEQKK